MMETASNRHLTAVQHALSALEQRHAEMTGSIPVLTAALENEPLAS